MLDSFIGTLHHLGLRRNKGTGKIKVRGNVSEPGPFLKTTSKKPNPKSSTEAGGQTPDGFSLWNLPAAGVDGAVLPQTPSLHPDIEPECHRGRFRTTVHGASSRSAIAARRSFDGTFQFDFV